jgi:hypothetical protein
MHETRSARLAPLGALLAAGLVLAACGGGSSHPASAAPTTTTSTTVAGARGGAGTAALAAFRSCMSSHGVTLATRPRGASGAGRAPSTTPGETRPPGGGGGFGGGNFANRFNTPPAGVDPTKYQAALAACRSKLPTGTGNALNNTAFQAYRSCLKDHGVTLPATGGAGSINRNDPKVQAAMKTCQPLLPAGGFGRSTTTTTAPSA